MKKEGDFCDPKKKLDVADFFAAKYPELKTKYVAYKEAVKDYDKLVASIKTDITKKGKLTTYKTNLDAYNELVHVAAHTQEAGFDPATQMVVDSKKAALATEKSLIGLTEDQLKVLTVLNSKHTDYLNFK